MSELKARHIVDVYDSYYAENPFGERSQVYLKSEADKVIAEKDAEICGLKNGIAPKQSDKTLQERLNEVCEKHGVSTLQDLDWAFCESEKRRTRDSIESANMIAELKEKLDLYKRGWAENDKIIAYLCAELKHNKYKRCLAVARRCHNESLWWYSKGYGFEKYDKFWEKWEKRWLTLADKYKEGNV